MCNVYLVGGPNGAGKTTIAGNMLSRVGCNEFVNADNIARGLSPFNVEGVAIQAGRLMLKRIDELVDSKSDFAFESTLAAKSFEARLKKCKSEGYNIHLLYVWLASSELAVQRVARRVINNGHNIPEMDIRRRYDRGRENFNDLYLPIADTCLVYNNSRRKPELIAKKNIEGEIIVFSKSTWKKITNQNGKR